MKIIVLLEGEFEELLHALRRDLRHSEQRKQATGDDEYGWYVRQDVRLLEVLNPKHTQAQEPPVPRSGESAGEVVKIF